MSQSAGTPLAGHIPTLLTPSSLLFSRQVSQSRARSFEQKYGLPVPVQLEFGRKMARLQYLKCISSRNSGDWEVLLAEWRRAFRAVVSQPIFNDTFRFCVGPAVLDRMGYPGLLTRRIEEVLTPCQDDQLEPAIALVSPLCLLARMHKRGSRALTDPSLRLLSFSMQFLGEGPHHPSVVACLQDNRFGQIAWPVPTPTEVEVKIDAPVVEVLIPPDLSSTPFVQGESERAAIAAYVGTYLRQTGLDFKTSTTDLSGISLAFVPGSNVLLL